MAQVKPASLPKDLKPIHVTKAVDFIERDARDLVDLYFEQANVFSGIVGILGAKALARSAPTSGTSIQIRRSSDSRTFH